MAELLWFFAVGVAPFIVGAIIIYVLLRRRKLGRGEQAARDAKTRELYRDGQ